MMFKYSKRFSLLLFVLLMMVMTTSAVFADDESIIKSVTASNWGSYESASLWLNVNANIDGASDNDLVTFFLTDTENGTEDTACSEDVKINLTVSDLPNDHDPIIMSGNKSVGFMITGLAAGEYWIGCKLETGNSTSYSYVPFIVFDSLKSMASYAKEKLIQHYSDVLFWKDEKFVGLSQNTGNETGMDWEAWIFNSLGYEIDGDMLAGENGDTYLDYLEAHLSDLSTLTLKDYFRYITSLAACGEDPRSFRGINLVASMMDKASDQQIVARAKNVDLLFLSYFLLACRIAGVTEAEGFSKADMAACYEGLLSDYDKTINKGIYIYADNYAMSMLPLCFDVDDEDLQSRINSAKQKLIEEFTSSYMHINGAIPYGTPSSDNTVFTYPNANSSAALINTLVLMGYKADDLEGSSWQREYGSLFTAFMTQMLNNGGMTYGGVENRMATYQTLGALADLINGKSCFEIARDNYRKNYPQYFGNYIDPESVTVYLTVSDDGDFVIGNDPDSTVLASTPLEVEYFDLAEYGLEEYNYDEAVDNEQPTLLHAYIRATERYYLDRKMTPLDFKDRTMMATGSPSNLYLKYFWGHDENILYHHNHTYPYQEGSTTIGATCDQVLLSDGDTIDVAMFTDWGISTTGAFAFFDNDSLSVNAGEAVELNGYSTGGILNGLELQRHIMENEMLKISRDGGRTWVKEIAKANSDGVALLRFMEPGEYYVSAGPEFSEYEDAVGADYRCVAPPICVIEVTGDPVEYEPHTVSFESCGGSTVAQQSVGWYCSADKPKDPVRDGYDFTGWYSDAELTNKYDFDLAVKSNITLYAGWKETDAHAEEQRKKKLAAKKKAAKAAKTTITVKALRKQKAKVTWKKVALSYTVDGKKYTGAVSGYKVYRATKKKGNYKLIKTIKKAGTLKYTDKKLKKGKKYFYKVRTYTKISGTTYLGKWSKVKGTRAK